MGTEAGGNQAIRQSADWPRLRDPQGGNSTNHIYCLTSHIHKTKRAYDYDSSEEEIEVKLPKQKKSGADGNDEVYRRAYQRMFELH